MLTLVLGYCAYQVAVVLPIAGVVCELSPSAAVWLQVELEHVPDAVPGVRYVG